MHLNIFEIFRGVRACRQLFLDRRVSFLKAGVIVASFRQFGSFALVRDSFEGLAVYSRPKKEVLF